MAHDFSNASPAAVSDMISTFARVYDRLPKEYETIHQVTIDHLQKTKVDAKDPFDHVAEHFRVIFPLVVRDARLSKVTSRMVEEYDKMPVTPEIRLRKKPGDHSVGVAVAVGVGLAVIVAGCIVGYCLGGEGDEVRC